MNPPINGSWDIAEIILKACNYYPKDRYESAKDLRDNLEKVYYNIDKERQLFNYDEEQMNKLYEENTKSNCHNETVYVLTSPSNSKNLNDKLSLKDENIENDTKANAKDSLKSELIETNMDNKKKDLPGKKTKKERKKDFILYFYCWFVFL